MEYNIKYRDEYLNYMIDKITTLNLKHQDIIIESLNNIRKNEPDSTFIKKLIPIHSHYYRDMGLDFLDYFNFQRCKELNLKIE